MPQNSAIPSITHIQSIYFELIKTINYNTLNGAKVVEDWTDEERCAKASNKLFDVEL